MILASWNFTGQEDYYAAQKDKKKQCIFTQPEIYSFPQEIRRRSGGVAVLPYLFFLRAHAHIILNSSLQEDQNYHVLSVSGLCARGFLVPIR
jgi:hypothetical protein